ncbi:hypothetical protein HDU67_000416 [Dinochytrium kinnereticum]|nr:hypothetical protein HDU67_000416 [Dinochytrium kinnereticum]
MGDSDSESAPTVRRRPLRNRTIQSEGEDEAQGSFPSKPRNQRRSLRNSTSGRNYSDAKRYASRRRGSSEDSEEKENEEDDLVTYFDDKNNDSDARDQDRDAEGTVSKIFKMRDGARRGPVVEYFVERHDASRRWVPAQNGDINVEIIQDSEKDDDEDQDEEKGVSELTRTRRQLKTARNPASASPDKTTSTSKRSTRYSNASDSALGAPAKVATRTSQRRSSASNQPKRFKKNDEEDGDDSESPSSSSESDDEDDEDYVDDDNAQASPGQKRSRRNVLPVPSKRLSLNGKGEKKETSKPIVAPTRASQRTASKAKGKMAGTDDWIQAFHADDDEAFEEMLNNGVDLPTEKKPKPQKLDSEGRVIPKVPAKVPASHIWCSICLSEILKSVNPSTIRQCGRCYFSTHRSCLKGKKWDCTECRDHPNDVDTILTYRIPAREAPVEEEEKAVTGGARINTNAIVGSWEFLVKFEDMSFRDVEWVGARWLDGISKAKLTSFMKKNETPKTKEEVINPNWLIMENILEIDESSATILTKWKDQPIEKSTWEDIADMKPIPEALLAEYNKRLKVDSKADEQKVMRHLERWRQRPYRELGTQPKHIIGGALKEYQIEGLDWMMYNLHKGSNSILADDMGLGKTVQVAAFLAHAFHVLDLFPAIIVVPNATIANWMRELKKWAPNLVCVEYRGPEVQRKILENHVLFNSQSSGRGAFRSLGCHVVVTTYEMATLNSTVFKKVKWQVGVVDEAHRLKNEEAKLFVKLTELDINYKICLTVMSFMNPKEFNNSEEMAKEYKDLNSELVSKLHEQLRPYFLRRTKEEVLKGVLPSKKEVFVPVSMTRVQRELYKAALVRNVDLLTSLKGNSSTKTAAKRSSLNNILIELRKIMMHPYLMEDVEPEEEGVSPEVVHARLIESSSKLSLLHRLLMKLKAGGHRVLIFSHWTRMLDILEDYMNGEGISYGRLDGQCDADKKQKAIDTFNDPNSPNFVFLVSTRAGGQGVNLATADTIIIYDSDFNPHMDIQAMARCHRIGQTKPVLILKIFVKQSAEEKILEMAAKKLLLDHVIVEQMDAKIETNDIESVLRFGANALFEEDDTQAESKAITYTDEDLSQLIDRTAKEQEQDETVPNKVFGYTKSWKATATEPRDGVEPPSSPGDHGDVSDHEETHDAGDGFWNDLLNERLEKAQAERDLAAALGKGKRNRTSRVQYGFRSNDHDLDDMIGKSSPLSKADGKGKRKGKKSEEIVSSPMFKDSIESAWSISDREKAKGEGLRSLGYESTDDENEMSLEEKELREKACDIDKELGNILQQPELKEPISPGKIGSNKDIERLTQDRDTLLEKIRQLEEQRSKVLKEKNGDRGPTKKRKSDALNGNPLGDKKKRALKDPSKRSKENKASACDPLAKKSQTTLDAMQKGFRRESQTACQKSLDDFQDAPTRSQNSPDDFQEGPIRKSSSQVSIVTPTKSSTKQVKMKAPHVKDSPPGQKRVQHKIYSTIKAQDDEVVCLDDDKTVYASSKYKTVPAPLSRSPRALLTKEAGIEQKTEGQNGRESLKGVKAGKGAKVTKSKNNKSQSTSRRASGSQAVRESSATRTSPRISKSQPGSPLSMSRVVANIEKLKKPASPLGKPKNQQTIHRYFRKETVPE